MDVQADQEPELQRSAVQRAWSRFTEPLQAAVRDLRFGPRGYAVEYLNDLGRRYAVYMRLVTLLPTLIVAILAASSGITQTVAASLMLVLACWSAVYSALLGGPSGSAKIIPRQLTWITSADAVVISAVALSAQWAVPIEWLEHGKSWIIPFGACAIVGYQYSAVWVTGGLAAGIVCSGTVIGTILALPEDMSSPSVITAFWGLAIAMFSRLLWTVIYLGGIRADKAAAAAATARRLLREEQERIADEEDLADLLHGHAITTLTWVGAGNLPGLEPMLRARAQEDLLAIKSYAQNRIDATADLMALLRRRIDLQPLEVELDGPSEIILPIRPALSMAEAASEALVNVGRHANVKLAAVAVQHLEGHVSVKIVDQGVGFDSGSLQAENWGIRAVIKKRMEKIGGEVVITSKPNRGTTVSLRWSHV